ncbi:MAG: hypothetical protein RLZZ308_562 [Candidatus Parcubacteria bacterium]|jgi:uncharacterized repeat protein (TIGR01451 family)
MNTPPRKEDTLDAIEHELYDPKIKPHQSEMHRVRKERSLSLPTSWGDDSPVITMASEDKKVSFGVKLLIISVLVFISALSFTAWRVFSLRNVVSSANIDMTADISPFIEGGEVTPLALVIHNRNQVALENVKVTMMYKQGKSSLDELEKIQEKRDVGVIVPGEQKKQDFSVSLYGEEGETRDIALKIEYKVAGSNAVFNKTMSIPVILKTPPIAVSVQGVDTLSIGQSGEYTFTIKNNSATTSLPTLLQVMLPSAFSLEKSSQTPLPKSSSWSIAPLASGESVSIILTGSFSGKEGEVATFQAKIGSQGDIPKTIGIVYATQTIDVRLRASPLTVMMSLFTDRSIGDVIRYGDRSRIEITYNNTSLLALEDVSLVIQLSGDAALYQHIDPTSGHYDSVAKTITWNKAVFPDLAVIAPGAQGTLQVFIPIVQKGTNSPKLTASLVGRATTKASDDVTTTVTKTWVVQGSATLEAKTSYKNSVTINTGPIPPRVNEETSYTAKLTVSAENSLSATKVSFTLPIYVSWRGSVSDTQAISYNSKTRTVMWDAGAMKEGEIKSVEIGLVVKPSQSHLNQSPAITSGIILEADEEVSRAHLKTTLSPLTTKIKDESWDRNPSIVVE